MVPVFPKGILHCGSYDIKNYSQFYLKKYGCRVVFFVKSFNEEIVDISETFDFPKGQMLLKGDRSLCVLMRENKQCFEDYNTLFLCADKCGIDIVRSLSVDNDLCFFDTIIAISYTAQGCDAIQKELDITPFRLVTTNIADSGFMILMSRL